MKRDETVYLRHILDAIGKVETYLVGVDETAFKRSSLIQDGVIRQIEIIGEATRRLSRTFRAHIPKRLGKISQVCATSWSMITLGSTSIRSG